MSLPILVFPVMKGMATTSMRMFCEVLGCHEVPTNGSFAVESPIRRIEFETKPPTSVPTEYSFMFAQHMVGLMQQWLIKNNIEVIVEQILETPTRLMLTAPSLFSSPLHFI